MAELVLLAMLIASIFYVLFAGADFGATIVEPFLGRDGRHEVEVALAPVWEANHVWLVLLVVLAFTALPELYAVISTTLHLPLLIALFGIVLRGSAFTFRHYDDPHSGRERAYTLLLRLGSVLTPLALGACVGALLEGRIQRVPTDFWEAYVAPWTTPFAAFVAFFVTSLFVFEGTTLLAAEMAGRDASRLPHLRIARIAQGLVLASGGAVLALGFHSHMEWFTAFLDSKVALACFAIATLMVALVGVAFHRARANLVRLSLGVFVSAIVVGIFVSQAPVLVRFADRPDLVLETAVAPSSALPSLVWALGIGLALVLPALVFLIVVSKRPPAHTLEWTSAPPGPK